MSGETVGMMGVCAIASSSSAHKQQCRKALSAVTSGLYSPHPYHVRTCLPICKYSSVIASDYTVNHQSSSVIVYQLLGGTFVEHLVKCKQLGVFFGVELF